MNLPTPESGTQPPVNLLKGNVVEVPSLERELMVSAENIGANRWHEMFDATKQDGLERGLIIFRNLISGRFIESDVIKGTSKHIFSFSDAHGSKSRFSSAAVTVHTHFSNKPENAHLETLPPVDGDIQILFNGNFSAGSMVIN